MRDFRGIAVSLLLSACVIPVSAANAASTAKPGLGQWGVDLTSMDTAIRPGDDFFEYVNGTWLKTAKIPDDRASTGSFQDLRIQSEKQMRAIVERLEAKPYDALSPDEKKLRDLYDAFMDQKQIEERGLKPVEADLAYLQSLNTLDDVARAMGSTRLQTNSIFSLSISADDKQPDSYAVFTGQSGLGMPDRDYYLRDDPALAKTREAYKKYLAAMLSFVDSKDAMARAAKIYDLETAIAKAEWPNAERRDPDKTYNPLSITDLQRLTPGFSWAAFLGEAGISKDGPKGERNIIVAEKSAFPELAKIFAKTPVAVWRDYLTVHYLRTYAAFLPKAIDEENFTFYGKVINGNAKQLDRATRGVHLLDNNIGEALGKLYVAEYFPPESKTKMQALVANLLKAYEADLQTLDWMTPQTRKKALDKLRKFTPYIAYPDKWRDYSALEIKRSDLIGDIQRSAEFEWNRNLKRLDQPVDKSEWEMTPQTVNAYYSPAQNKIVFPAAILQPPFFDPHADDAVNYGAIGAVIGHEISHGFDDRGSKYDGDGVLHNWWTDADRKNFDARTKRLGEQYDSYEPLPGLHVNGAFTMGENIADLAGLSIAYKAYRISLDGKTPPVLNGFTGNQRFFLGFGQVWKSKYRDNAIRAQILSDPHSPPHFRAVGATRNVDAWYDAFDVKPGAKYYLAPDQRVHLW